MYFVEPCLLQNIQIECGILTDLLRDMFEILPDSPKPKKVTININIKSIL